MIYIKIICFTNVTLCFKMLSNVLEKHMKKTLYGAAIPFLLAALATVALPALGLARYGISALTLAMLAGALLGNAIPGLSAGAMVPGLRFAQRRVLRDLREDGVAREEEGVELQRALGDVGVGEGDGESFAAEIAAQAGDVDLVSE